MRCVVCCMPKISVVVYEQSRTRTHVQLPLTGRSSLTIHTTSDTHVATQAQISVIPILFSLTTHGHMAHVIFYMQGTICAACGIMHNTYRTRTSRTFRTRHIHRGKLWSRLAPLATVGVQQAGSSRDSSKPLVRSPLF